MVSSFQPSHVNPKTISYQNVPFNDESNLSVVFLFKACLAMWNVFGEYLHRWQCYNVAVLYAECYENVTELQSLQECLHRWLLLRAINWSSFFSNWCAAKFFQTGAQQSFFKLARCKVFQTGARQRFCKSVESQNKIQGEH